MLKTIVCFANSRKTGGYCFAGKDIESREWIRPVSNRQNEELNAKEECISNEVCDCKICDPVIPQLLDVIEIELNKPIPDGHQVENYSLLNNRWRKVGTLKHDRIGKYIDPGTDTLWINGYSSNEKLNDRIPSQQINGINDSLRLIEITSLDLLVQNITTQFETHKTRLYGSFDYSNTKYILPITDIQYESMYANHQSGTYKLKIDKESIILCISIGKDFNGYLYKFIAGIMLIE